MNQPDDATIESWKIELAQAATTRARIKDLVTELEEFNRSKNEKISVELVTKKIKKLDPYWGMF